MSYRGVLWAYRTTQRSPTGEMPFALAFINKTVILVEIGMTNLRTQRSQTEQAEKELPAKDDEVPQR